VEGAADGSAAVRQAVPEADIRLNGVRLGAEPAPVLHGDMFTIGGHEVLCVDPRRSGSTQFVSAADLAKLVGPGIRPATQRPATGSTGGRLVCLTDGREYAIGSAPLVFGREANCDIVVPNKDVSRRHAEILATPQGYVVVDSSINGTFVNGDRVQGQRVLARADVIRVGDHDFRFYADAATASPSPAAAQASPPPPPPAPSSPPPMDLRPVEPGGSPSSGRISSTAPSVPPLGAQQRLFDTVHGVSVPAATAPPPIAPPPIALPPRPSATAPAARPSAAAPLASILVRSGGLKGARLTIRVPVVNIGRADYNDLVVPDESVSTSHAKLQRREEVWVLTDLGSTNGTFVDGERISGETALSPGASIRFGEVSAIFDPVDDGSDVAKGGGTKVLGVVAAPPPPAPGPRASTAPRATPAPPAEPVVRAPVRRPPVVVSTPPSKSGVPQWVVGVAILAILAALAIFLLKQ
ncbi:MAG: FHA domain-containing protein, partial [Gemmatimonadales bacterium]